MPEEREIPETPGEPEASEHVREFENMLNRMAAGAPGLNVYELDTMSIVIMIRLRSIFTLEEIHMRCHALIEKMEGWIQQSGALIGQDGEPVDAVLAENFADKPDLIEMLSASKIPLADDEIMDFFDSEEE